MDIRKSFSSSLLGGGEDNHAWGVFIRKILSLQTKLERLEAIQIKTVSLGVSFG